jgi:hypothetical protein
MAIPRRKWFYSKALRPLAGRATMPMCKVTQ